MSPSTFFSVLVALSVGGFGTNLFVVLCLFLPRGEEGKKKLGKSATLAYRNVVASNLLFCLSIPTAFLPCLLQNLCFDHRIIPRLFLLFNCITLYCTVWFTAILCLFYCIKILQSVNSLFLKLKRNISTLLRWGMAIGILINLSASCFVFAVDACTFIISQNETDHSFQNVAIMKALHTVYGLFYVFFPLLVTLLSCVTILVYLCGHILKMTSHLGNIQQRLERQQRTVVLLSTQLLLYILFAAAILKVIWSDSCTESNYVCIVAFPLYSWAMATNLIFKTGFLRWKLEKICSRLLHSANRFLG